MVIEIVDAEDEITRRRSRRHDRKTITLWEVKVLR